MVIIDSNKDYYDYLQNIWRDKTVTFDRRNSYNLSKKEFANSFFDESSRFPRWTKKMRDNDSKHKHVLLQICNNFWLFDLFITKTDAGYSICTDYDLHLNCSWRDYFRPTELIKLSAIQPKYLVRHHGELQKDISEAVKRGDYKEVKVFNKFVISKSNGITYDKDVRSIPILKNLGIASEVPPEEIFLALEEYFLTQRRNAERTESAGLTDIEKVTSHGFDATTSFRGNAR